MFAKMQWMAIQYRLPALPSKNRVYVWRKLKKMGAVSIQQGIAVLPMSSEYLWEFEKLRDKIIFCNGEAMLITLNFLNESDEKKIEELYKNNVNGFYREIGKIFTDILSDVEELRKAKKLTLSYIEGKKKLLENAKREYEKEEFRSRLRTKVNEEIENIMKAVLSKINRYISED